MKKILIILNAVKYNRGSEALIRGLVRICKSENSDNKLYLVSSEPDFEDTVNIEGIDVYMNRYSFKSKYSIRRITASIVRKVFKNYELSTEIRCRKLIKTAKEMDIVIVIGADNYDKSYGMYSMMHSLNVVLAKNTKAKLYLYDCSLAKEDIDKDVIDDFNLFTKVTVRENVTLDNLSEYIEADKLCYYPDPAFLMEPVRTKLPNKWQDNNMIGINLSSLVLHNKYGSNKDKILEAYYNMIDYILEETGYNIVFIPHVMQRKDLEILEILYEKYNNSGRVILISDETLSAPELKYIISKCKYFMAARTHASIAAYSQCVPTLVMGYSVKSKGIARDLFGTEDNYVISTKSIKSGMELRNGIEWLIENGDNIRKALENRVPQYKEEAMKAVELIK